MKRETRLCLLALPLTSLHYLEYLCKISICLQSKNYRLSTGIQDPIFCENPNYSEFRCKNSSLVDAFRIYKLTDCTDWKRESCQLINFIEYKSSKDHRKNRIAPAQWKRICFYGWRGAWQIVIEFEATGLKYDLIRLPVTISVFEFSVILFTMLK